LRSDTHAEVLDKSYDTIKHQQVPLSETI